MLTNPHVPCDLCIGVPISHLHIYHGLKPVQHNVLNVKKALVGAFSVIVKSSPMVGLQLYTTLT